MTVPYLAPESIRRTGPAALQSTSRFRWQARRRSLNAITGHVGTLVRASTATAVDANGVTFTAGHSAPRWEARDYASTGQRDTLGLYLGTDDLTWPANWLPEQATILIELVEAGTRTTANAGLVYLGNDAQTGARLIVDSSGTNYRATIHNGATSQSVSLATATPTTGQAAQLIVQLDDDGTNQRVRLILGATTTAWSSTVTRAAAWASSAKLRANRVGSAGTQGAVWIRQIAWDTSLLTATQMLERL